MLNVNVPLSVIPEVAADIVIVPPVGARVVLGFTVNTAATEKFAVGCVEGVPAIVNPLNVNVPLLLIPQPVPVIVIAPAVGASVMPEFTVNIPLTEKLAAVCVVGVTAIVNPLKAKVPLFVIPHPTADIVIVPPDGANVAEALTVSVLLMLHVVLAVYEVVVFAYVSCERVEVEDPPILCAPVPFRVSTPVPEVKVPLLTKLPARFKAGLFVPPLYVAPTPIVRLPVTVRVPAAIVFDTPERVRFAYEGAMETA